MFHKLILRFFTKYQWNIFKFEYDKMCKSLWLVILSRHWLFKLRKGINEAKLIFLFFFYNSDVRPWKVSSVCANPQGLCQQRMLGSTGDQRPLNAWFKCYIIVCFVFSLLLKSFLWHHSVSLFVLTPPFWKFLLRHLSHCVKEGLTDSDRI